MFHRFMPLNKTRKMSKGYQREQLSKITWKRTASKRVSNNLLNKTLKSLSAKATKDTISRHYRGSKTTVQEHFSGKLEEAQPGHGRLKKKRSTNTVATNHTSRIYQQQGVTHVSGCQLPHSFKFQIETSVIEYVSPLNES